MQNDAAIKNIDSDFKERIEFGEKSLVVYCKRAYQMIDFGDRFIFAEIRGFDGECIDAVYYLKSLSLDSLRGRKKFIIKKSDITKAEIFGTYKDYFTLSGAEIVLHYKKRKREKRVVLRLFGEINQFTVRDFLHDVGDVQFISGKASEMTYAKNAYFHKDEPGVYGSLVTYFNNKCGVISRLMWFLAILSVVLMFIGASQNAPYSDIIKGISTLLPLLIFFLYIKYNRLIYFISSSFGEAQPKYERKRAECYCKIVIPTIFAMLGSVFSFGMIIEMRAYVIASLIFSAVMLALFLIFTSEYKTRFKLVFICVMVCVIYSFVAVNDFNKIYHVEDGKAYQTVVVNKRERVGGKAGTTYYFSIKLKNGELKEITVKESQYDSVIEGKTTVTVSEYRGIFGIACAEVELED